MKLNHINLVVKDVNQAEKLFTNHFGFVTVVNRNNMMSVLQNDDQFVLVIWGQVLNHQDDLALYPKNFHIGFYQPDEKAVWEVYGQLKTIDLLQFEDEPKMIRNTFGFYVYFETVMIEISVRPINN